MLVSVIFCHFLSLVTALSFFKQVKTRRNAANPRIIGGNIAFAGQFPFLAAIHIHTPDAIFFCGGTLMNTEWVVTSAHCADEAVLFTIQLGSHTLDSNDTNLLTLSSEDFVLHPNYDRNNLANDIAAIKFRMPITYTNYIKPINSLPGSQISGHSLLSAMGWGQISDSEAGIQDNVYWVYVSVIPNEQCRIYYGDQILESMACAEGTYNQGICFGDTGGPLIQHVSRAEVMLVGIGSFISQNGCESTDPSGFTRTLDFVDWITNTTGFFNTTM